MTLSNVIVIAELTTTFWALVAGVVDSTTGAPAAASVEKNIIKEPFNT